MCAKLKFDKDTDWDSDTIRNAEQVENTNQNWDCDQDVNTDRDPLIVSNDHSNNDRNELGDKHEDTFNVNVPKPKWDPDDLAINVNVRDAWTKHESDWISCAHSIKD